MTTLCVLTTHCEWRSYNHKSEVATWRRKTTDNEQLRWPPAEPTEVGQRAKCSLAHCRQFPLERLASLMWEECLVAGRWVKMPAEALEWSLAC
jgi:hypothetical protein